MICRAQEWLFTLSYFPSYAPLITFFQTFLYAPQFNKSSEFLHAILLEYVLGQDNVSRTRMIVPPFLVSKLCPFDYFFPEFLYAT